MKAETKRAIRAWTIRRLIRLVDRAEEWLQTVQVRLRENLAVKAAYAGKHASKTGGSQCIVLGGSKDVPATRLSPLESLSPQKETNANAPTQAHKNTVTPTHDANAVAQFDQQTSGSKIFAAHDARGMAKNRHHETYPEWEARRSGVAVISKREARRRSSQGRLLSASDFDRRYV